MRKEPSTPKAPKPTLHSGDLANPPAALRPLLERPQWAIWRLIWDGTRWHKPPFQARNPQQHASSADPSTWTDYPTAVAAAGHGDGVTYVLTPEDELAALDIDHVRDPATGAIREWAQRLLDQAEHAYCEVSPSGSGLRIWGAATGAPIQRQFKLENDTALELFRRTRKPLTVTGLQLGRCQQFGNIDRLIERAPQPPGPDETPPWEEQSEAAPEPAPTQEQEQEQEEPDLEPDIEESALDLPPMYSHGDPDPRPLKSWLVKHLMATTAVGLLSGQWGTGKTFVALELASAVMTGQPFLGRMIKRQCGVLFLAAEGSDEVRIRLEATVHEKCGSMPRAPFRWYEIVPVLLQPGAADKLIAMARQAHESLMKEFGLPLGLIILDTVAASAGYNTPGAENDNAVNQALMNTMRMLATAIGCFVLGVDHFGKQIETGTRGGSAKEASADLVLACLGERELSGRVLNTRLTVRKNRSGPHGSSES